MDNNRRVFAKSVMRRVAAKISGSANNGTAHLSVDEQVKYLIAQATSSKRLCRMYEGWMAWL
jgi:phosphatidylinositol kinase/protein kinase (PI-3  family)